MRQIKDLTNIDLVAIEQQAIHNIIKDVKSWDRTDEFADAPAVWGLGGMNLKRNGQWHENAKRMMAVAADPTIETLISVAKEVATRKDGTVYNRQLVSWVVSWAYDCEVGDNWDFDQIAGAMLSLR